MTERLLTVKETMERLRLGKTTIYDLIGSGQLRSIKIKGARRISETAIHEFITSVER